MELVIDTNIIFSALLDKKSREFTIWTGDKNLIEGLKRKGYEKTITTAELIKNL